MRNVKSVTYHSFLSLVIHFVSSTNDEFYCKVDLGNYEICRKCPTLADRCEIPRRNDGCQCDNIKFTDASMIFLFDYHITIRWFLCQMKRNKILVTKVVLMVFQSAKRKTRQFEVCSNQELILY